MVLPDLRWVQAQIFKNILIMPGGKSADRSNPVVTYLAPAITREVNNLWVNHEWMAMERKTIFFSEEEKKIGGKQNQIISLANHFWERDVSVTEVR